MIPVKNMKQSGFNKIHSGGLPSCIFHSKKNETKQVKLILRKMQQSKDARPFETSV
jgi:hypothetical protein